MGCVKIKCTQLVKPILTSHVNPLMKLPIYSLFQELNGLFVLMVLRKKYNFIRVTGLGGKLVTMSSILLKRPTHI